MSARQWTREELDRVHPLPVGWAWEYDRQTGWFVRGPRKSSVCVDPDSGSVVAVINGPGHTDHFPPHDVALPVILASKGMDSLSEMASHAEREVGTAQDSCALFRGDGDDASAECERGQALAWTDAATMLRRGTVSP